MLSISKDANKNYLAKVIKLENLRKHNNADRLQVTTIDFNDVILGLEAEIGMFYVYFPIESQVNYEFLRENNSFDSQLLNKDANVKGYFGKHCRVRAVRLRGEKSVGKKVIMGMYNKYLRKENILEQDENAPRSIIVDIDGTICRNDGKRGWYDWNKVYLDEENVYVTNVVRAMSHTHNIIIVSGRDGSCYDMTKKWLEDHNVPFDKLLMRKAGDMRPDTVVKEEIFDNFVRGKYNVECVIDDRPSVCNSWRKIGLKTLQCGDPNFEF